MRTVAIMMLRRAALAALPIGRPGRAAIEPMILQVGVACQLDAVSRGVLSLAHLASAVYGGRGY
jgi:hypothetical protein